MLHIVMLYTRVPQFLTQISLPLLDDCGVLSTSTSTAGALQFSGMLSLSLFPASTTINVNEY